MEPLKLGFGVPYFNTFFLKEPLWNKSSYFFLPGYLKAQEFVMNFQAPFRKDPLNEP